MNVVLVLTIPRKLVTHVAGAPIRESRIFLNGMYTIDPLGCSSTRPDISKERIVSSGLPSLPKVGYSTCTLATS
jgi:hypothetical protein